MRWSLKFALPLVALALALPSCRAEAKKNPETVGEKPKESTKGGDKDKDKGNDKLPFPVPVGHDSKGLKLPSYGPDGKLKMMFTIGLATRINDNDVQMAEMSVQTYDDAGEPEMMIELPTSSFNLATKVLSTKQAAKISRDDFELTGQTLEFNTETRAGKLGGGVKMIIFNLDEATDAAPKVSFPGTDKPPTLKVNKPPSKPASEPQPRE